MPHYFLSLLLFTALFLTPTTTTTSAPATLTLIPSPAPTTPTVTPNTGAAAATLTPTLSPAHTPTLSPNTSTTRTLVPTSSPAPSPLVISNITTTTIITAARHSPHNRRGHRQQLRNIIDALVGAGDFNIWANVLSVADPSTLPLSTTLFIPADDSRSPITTTITIDPYIFPYHIVPQRLSFSELGQFKLYSRLPTLLAAKSILITNNSISNYTLDGSLVSHPDLFTNGNVAVHGIATLLDYSVYGEAHPKPSQPEVLLRPPSGMFVPEGELINDHPVTNSGCLCSEVWTVFVIFCAVFASKIQRMCLGH